MIPFGWYFFWKGGPTNSRLEREREKRGGQPLVSDSILEIAVSPSEEWLVVDTDHLSLVRETCSSACWNNVHRGGRRCLSRRNLDASVTVMEGNRGLFCSFIIQWQDRIRWVVTWLSKRRGRAHILAKQACWVFVETVSKHCVKERLCRDRLKYSSHVHILILMGPWT